VSPLCRVEDIADRSGRGFTVRLAGAETAIMVVRLGDTLRAYVNSCPHLGMNLDWQPDLFFDFERRHLLCGAHGARFRVADGVCIDGPCLGRALTPVAIEVRDGEIRLAPAENG
jgi:nitrite reductase/ring-hydroxylating ferredoxin subunit